MYLLQIYNKEKLSDVGFRNAISLIPSSLHASIMRYARWQDQQASLFGKLLLAKGLEKYGYSRAEMSNMRFSVHKKPFLPIAGLAFNISHTDGLVVCLINDNGIVGVDVERILPIELESFEFVFQPHEWEWIQNDLTRFYSLWTLKEAVLKAKGHGFYSSPKEIDTLMHPDRLTVGSEEYFFLQRKLEPDFIITIATGTPQMLTNLRFEEFTFSADIHFSRLNTCGHDLQDFPRS